MPRRKLFKTDTWEFGHDSRAQEQPLAKPSKHRAATTVVYAALFFAGATFTAFAGDHFSQMTGSEDSAASASDSTSTDTTTTDASDSASSDALAPSAAADPAAAAQTPDASAAAPAAAPAASDPAAADTEAAAPGSSAGWSTAPASTGSHTTSPAASGWRAATKKTAGAKTLATGGFRLLPVAKPEIEGPASAATIWLNRALPDPTPAALRLSPKFAKHLMAVSKSTGVDWSLMLGVLRAQGARGHNPATAATLHKLAFRLVALRKHAGGAWATALAYQGRPAFADKTLALAHYDRAVGLGALVHGLEATKRSLEQRLLDDPAISIYPGGRDDIAKDKVRVLATIAYLRQSFGQITVSCLISGHRLYARPGVVSAHIYGHAVDVSALGNTPILGHQQPGGLTEQAVHDILLLPNEVMPKQVISLLGLGGPSFPLANHYNHIHIGW